MEEIKESGYADKLGSGIVLTGGGAYLKDIDTLFRERTKYDVRTGSAYPELVNDRSLPAADDMHLSSAIGLLLLGLQESRIAADAEPLRKREKTEEQTDTAADRQTPTDAEQQPQPDHGEDARKEKEEDTVKRPTDGDTPRTPNNGKGKDKKRPFGGIGRIFKEIFEVVDDDEI